MKKQLLLSVFMLFGFVGFAQIDCAKFRTGTFKEVGQNRSDVIISRNDSIQVETAGEAKVRLGIHWINDCTYKLVFLAGNEAYWDTLGEKEQEWPDIIVRIVKTEKNYCWIEAKVVGSSIIYKSQLEKVAKPKN